MEHSVPSLNFDNMDALISALPGAVCVLIRKGEADYQIAFVTEGIEKLTGYSGASLMGNLDNVQNCIHPEDLDGLCRSFNASAKTLTTFNESVRIIKPDGSICWVLLDVATQRMASGDIRWSIYIKDHTEHEAALKQLKYVAHYDPLTGLPNRSIFTDRLLQTLARERRDPEGGAVLFIDLDGFKEINDQFGHEAGDALLIDVAKNMKSVLRETDTIARLGGDEFCAVLTGLSQHNFSQRMLDRLLQAIDTPISHEGNVLRVSGSIGVTFYPQLEELDPDQLLRQADQAMYQAKQLGKNRYYIFNQELDRKERQRNQTLQQIKQALDNNEFLLFYQPKINLRTKEVIGVEALIRWQHPTRGLLPAAEFLPLLNNHSLSIQIGEWVIEQVIEKLRVWRQAGIDLSISVNVSSNHLCSDGFIDFIRTALKQYPDLPDKKLEFEVREMNHLDNLPEMILRLGECNELGIGITFDNFGIGYLSLTCLWQLPAERIKIDQSFVKDMLSNHNDQAIVRAVISLANSFGRQVIASGIETDDVAKALLSQGCEMGEGYFIAKPMPADQVPTWLNSWQG